MTIPSETTHLLDFLPPSFKRSLSSLPQEEICRKVLEAWDIKHERERYAFFEPNGKQAAFIQLLGYYRPFVAILSAANGVGKTALASNIAANLIFGPQSKPFADYELFRAWPYPKRARFITDSKLVEEIGPWHTEAQYWWPKGRYSASKGGKQWYSQYKGNGWILDVMTNDQQVKEFEGATLGLVIFDEPPTAPIWHATVARMRKGGLVLVLMTPLTAAAWFFDQVVPKHQTSIIYADLEDNCKEHGQAGQLLHVDIERMIAEMSPDEVEARAHGKALALAYLVYKTFDRRIHVSPDPVIPPPGAQVWQIVDPHIDKPFACIWGFPGADGSFTQFDEWPNDDFYISHKCHYGLADYRDIFRKKEEKLNVVRRIVDRHFAQVRSYVSKRTLFEEFEDLGLNYEPSYKAGPDEKEVETGVLKVRSFLSYDPAKAVDGANRPKYTVSPTCHNTIKGFERWSFEPKTMDYSDNYKDFCDVVRYAVMANPAVVNVPLRREPSKRFG